MRRWGRLGAGLAAWLGAATGAAAQTPVPGFSTPPGVVIQDEGVGQGRARTLNCTGAGVTCSVATGVATVNVPGGGAGATWTTVEVDFSDDPTSGSAGGSRFVAKATVVDATVSATSRIIAVQAGTAATGRQADENEMDDITCRGIPATGQFTLICSSSRSVTHGLFAVHYTVG